MTAPSPAAPVLLIDHVSDRVLVVTINRPDRANAIDTAVGRALRDLFANMYLDTGDLRCAIITGAGRHFCGGGDLGERDGMSAEDWNRQHALFEQAFAALADCPIPVIAAVNGAAFGGGAELALACDFIYAARTASFALVETGVGIIPGSGGTQRLPRAVGARRASELIFSCQPFSAEDAERWGLANRVLAPEGLLPEAIAVAERIARNAPLAVRRAKQAIRIGSEIDIRSGLAFELESYNRLVATEDRLEGIAAARARRAPAFRGR